MRTSNSYPANPQRNIKHYNKNITQKLVIQKLNKRLLKQNALTMEEIWKRNGESEDDIDIRYRSGEDDPHYSPQSIPEPTRNQDNPEIINSVDSKNLPLALTPKNKDSQRKIYPSEKHFTIGDKTTKFIEHAKTSHENLSQEKQKNRAKHLNHNGS